MGMNHLREIAYLSRLARPTAALINNAGTAHIGELGSTEAIARAKGEIFEGLDLAGTAIINSDDAFADYWRGLAKPRRAVDFGLDRKAAVSARYELADAGSLVTIVTPESQFVATLNVPGLHNVKNALAAAAAAYALGIEAEGHRRRHCGLSRAEGQAAAQAPLIRRHADRRYLQRQSGIDARRRLRFWRRTPAARSS